MTAPSNKKVFKVGAVGVRIRTEPRRAASEVRWAKADELLACDPNSRTEAEGFVWWKHGEGWSAERNLAGTEFYMHEQVTAGAAASTPAPAAQPAPVASTPVVTTSTPAPAAATTAPTAASVTYKVGSMMVRVRETPSLSGRELKWLNPGETVQVDENTRTTAEGFVWVKHQHGWSALKNLDETLIFLYIPPAETPAAPAVTTAPATTPTPAADASRASAIPTSVIPAATTPAAVTAPATTAAPAATAAPASIPGMGTVVSPPQTFRVSRTQVRVRQTPSLNGTMVRWMLPGETLVANRRLEAEGFIWWNHAEGWTAERSLDGTQEFLVDPETFAEREAEAAEAAQAPSAVATPDGASLPNLNALFTRFPMALDQTQWWQYFGNNVFAYNLWRDGKKWYAYCQALHGGLDFGNSSTRGIPIYAGVNGTYQKTITTSYAPFGIFVKSGDYTIIYGHLANPRQFAPGAIITPETVMGECQVPGQNHLHLEVRYKEVWIVNPLLLFSEAMRGQIISKFPPGPNYFYRDATWNQWQTPLDQPLLKLGAPNILGPHAR